MFGKCLKYFIKMHSCSKRHVSGTKSFNIFMCSNIFKKRWQKCSSSSFSKIEKLIIVLIWQLKFFISLHENCFIKVVLQDAPKTIPALALISKSRAILKMPSFFTLSIVRWIIPVKSSLFSSRWIQCYPCIKTNRRDECERGIVD